MTYPSPTKESVLESIPEGSDAFGDSVSVMRLESVGPADFQSYDCVCIVPHPTDIAGSGLRLIALCEAAGLNNVVLVSHVHPDWTSMTSSPSLFQFFQLESALKASRIAGHCILRTTLLQQHIVDWWLPDVVSSRKLRLPIDKAVLAPIHVCDLARTVVALFAMQRSHAPAMCPSFRSKVYHVAGPSLSGPDMADAFQQILSQPIEFVSNSHNEAKRYLQKATVSLVESEMVLEYFDALRRDCDDDASWMNIASCVKKFTCVEPRQISHVIAGNVRE